jgi:hypothetical protein
LTELKTGHEILLPFSAKDGRWRNQRRGDFGTSSIGEHVGSLKGQAEITDVKEVPLRQSDMKRELNYSGDLMRQQNPLNPSSDLPMAVALTSGTFFFYSNLNSQPMTVSL